MNGRPTRRTKWLSTCALIAAGAVIASGCGSGDSTADPEAETVRPVQEEVGDPVDGGSLVYGLPAESNGWDPAGGNWAPWGMIVARTFFDTLTVFDENGDVQPHLAESLTPNEDYSEWVVKLRPDITFHNGEALNAEVLKANWEFLTSSPLTGAIFQVLPGEFEVISELELKATYPEPYATFPAAWATQLGVVMAPESLAQDGPTRARNPIGTGPFMMDEWVIDNHLTVVKNDNYWQEGLPHLNEIEFRPIVDQTSRSSALEAGDVDLAFFDNPSQFLDFQDDEDFVIWRDPKAETAESFMMFNTQTAPFDNPDLRRALAMATDARTFTEVMTPGREVASGPYEEDSRWFSQTSYPGYDPEAAKALIAEIEAETGAPVQVNITSSPSVTTAEQSQLIAQMWDEVGVDVQVQTAETATLIIDIATGNYQAVLWRQFDSASPTQETVWWSSDYVNDPGQISLNFARNANDATTAALIEARKTPEFDERYDHFAEVQEQLALDIPYVWLNHIETAVVAEAGVIGVLDYLVPGTEDRAMSFQNSAHFLPQVWIQQ